MDYTACAKINWDLKIIGKRPDGYHEIDTVMVQIGLSDRLSIEAADDFSLTCSDPRLPCDSRNLVVKAAQALAEAARVPLRGRLHLEKKVPAGGGLGGGSSDAACALQALNRLWGLDWPREKLSEIAATLGSDIGFFLWGGWARCRGRAKWWSRCRGARLGPRSGYFFFFHTSHYRPRRYIGRCRRLFCNRIHHPVT